MRIISLGKLREFWEQIPYRDAEQPLRAWYDDAKNTNWTSPQSVKEVYRNASIIADNRVVFNIKGNDYRLVVKIHYDRGIVYIRFIGTHKQYDSVDSESI
jgi:mRNA interferase HigB